MSVYYRQASVQSAITGWIESGEYQYTNATDYLRKRIAELPPADVAPVIHAEWVSMARPHSAEDVCKCSNCGVVVIPYEFWNYCPKCGARMDA